MQREPSTRPGPPLPREPQTRVAPSPQTQNTDDAAISSPKGGTGLVPVIGTDASAVRSAEATASEGVTHPSRPPPTPALRGMSLRASLGGDPARSQMQRGGFEAVGRIAQVTSGIV